ncbi:helix-turn-helix domain-containing protein [Natronoglycomyces albus]|uniref:Helix-turn-helix transcriptional regulator n=1 Tax=Natronoglycomyces albus TaxID=2811108 RepID=A0A895XLD9_9ACTN|nr:helix-turn-helix transcriptional regulator [Natronoglycomyces albus]QSB06521.1 helix-turn-helix transcriptional regulator [Natronoglycomyces albus]
MGQKPKKLNPERSPLDHFGALLRDLRERQDLSQAALAEKLLTTSAVVRKIEVAARFPNTSFIADCEKVLNAGGVLQRMEPLLERERSLRQRKQRAKDQAAASTLIVPVVSRLNGQ